MSTRQPVLITCLALLVLVFTCSAQAEIIVDPCGTGIAVSQNQQELFELNLTNSFDSDVEYSIYFEWLRNEDNQLQPPHRDDLGDEIASFNVGEGWWTGIAWDGEVMWGYDHNSGNVISFNPNAEEFERRFNANFQSTTGMTCVNGEIWIGRRQNSDIVRFDADGNNLGTINCPVDVAIGLAWDGENCWYCGLGVQTELFLIDPDGELVRRIAIPDEINDGWGTMEYVPDHFDGQLWWRDHGRSVYQMNIEGDEVEILQEYNINGGNDFGLAHDGENLWYTTNNTFWNVIDDGIVEFGLLILAEDQGVIPANDEITLEIDVLPALYEPGVYNILGHISLLTPDDNGEEFVESTITITLFVSIEAPVAELRGTITDASDNSPIENVQVSFNDHFLVRQSDEQGEVSFAEIPPENYEITYVAADYLPLTQEFEVAADDDEIGISVSLLHSTCLPDPQQVITEIAPDTDMQMNLDIENDGNGPLTYSIDRRLLGDANAEPWTLRSSINSGEIVEDTYIQGVVFANDRFYVAGQHNRDPLIYVLDRDGNAVDSYAQPGENDRGMSDLAYDGTNLWGISYDMVCAFTPAGEEVTNFEAPYSPAKNIAWDTDRECLWVCGTTTDIAQIDTEGNNIGELDNPQLRIYGLAYYSDDPDGYPLYIYTKERDTERSTLFKSNPDDGDIAFVTYLDHELDSSPMGCQIVNTYDIYSYVFIAIGNTIPDLGGDRIDIWQVDARKDWMAIEPRAGVIEAGATQEFTLTLDANGLPPEMFRGELVVTHDGVGGETLIPITLSVVEGPVHTMLTLDMDRGWNLVSLYLTPDEPDFPGIMQPIIDNGSLVMVKDGAGNFMHVEQDFNNLAPWDVAQGYYVKMDEASELSIEGTTVVSDEPINLDNGWSNIAYFLRSPINATVALSSITDALEIAKDGAGNFYSPEWDFNGIGNMMPLNGYQVKMTEAAELIYRMQMPDDGLASVIPSTPARAGILPRHANTGVNMSLLVLADDFDDSEIGIYANGELIGSGVVVDGRCGFALWGDDPSTEQIDGAVNGVAYEVKVLNNDDLADASFDVLRGDGLFSADDFEVISLSAMSSLPTEFGIHNAYPNPFNGRTSIDFTLTEAGRVDMALYDLGGRRVMEIGSDMLSAGNHTMTVNAEDLSSGVYFVNLSASGKTSRMKVTLLK